MSLKMAALGSSFAAGPGILPYDNVRALRSRRNYPHLSARALGAELTDLTVAGATTETILHKEQVTSSGARFAPQIEGLPADADIVTLTVGGNDVAFGGAMIATAWARHAPGSAIAEAYARRYPKGLFLPTPDVISRTVSGIVEVCRTIRSRAAGARIILVGYIPVFGPETSPTGPEVPYGGVPFTDEDISQLIAAQSVLPGIYDKALTRACSELDPLPSGDIGVNYIDAPDLGAGHEIGARDPWVFGFVPSKRVSVTAASFHPRAVAHEAIAREMVRVISS